MSRLRFVTLNTWKNEGRYTERVAAMAQQLAAMEADIVALQECFACEATGEDTAAALALATSLWLTRAPMRRKVRAHRGGMVESSSDLALLTRQAPFAWRILALPADPRDGERLAILADVAGLRVAATHLTHLRDAEAKRVRAAQGQALLAAARDDCSDPVVLMGDLNDPAESPTLSALFGDPGLDRGCVPEAVAAGDWLRLGAIDHILVFDTGPAWRVIGRRLCVNAPCPDGAAPSDHPGVCVDLVAV